MMPSQVSSRHYEVYYPDYRIRRTRGYAVEDFLYLAQTYPDIFRSRNSRSGVMVSYRSRPVFCG